MIRTALYIRVSTEEQVIHGLSLEAQDAVLTDYANKNDLTIVGRYVDEGITARKKMTNRKALMRLLEDVKDGNIDLIIFTKLDRWFRNVGDYHKIQEVLEKYKVNWKTVLENYDTTTATGRLHINIMLSIAQDEADRTSERVKVVFADKVKKGEYLNQNTPFGYRVENSKIYKDEETQHMAEDLFRKFFQCHSIRGTSIYMAETYGIVFDQKNFRNLLRNTLYCGEYRGVTDFCEPYLTREQFDEMQRILDTRCVKRTPTGINYVFTSMLICGECGNRLGSCYNARGEGRSQRITCYRCSRHSKNNSCGFNAVIMEKTIEQYLFKNGIKELDKYKEQYDFRVSEQKKKKNSGTTEKTAERIRKKLGKLKDLYVNDLINIEDYKKDYDDLNKQLADLLTEAQEEETPVDIEEIKKLLSESTEEIYQTLTAADRRSFWRGFIDRIIVHSRDDMEIIWK